MNNNLTTCNGWSNRETWLASLWLNNEEASYDLLQRAYNKGDDASSQAEWLENILHDQLDCEVSDEANMWSDLLSTAFNRVSWLEVIEKNLD